MGQCGCGDFSAFAKMPAPDGGFYSVGIYWGCGECHMPAGVRINKHTAEDARSWGVPSLPDLPFEEHLGEVLIPVFDPEALEDEIQDVLAPVEHRLQHARLTRIVAMLEPLFTGGLLDLIRKHQDRVREAATKKGC